MKKLFSIFFVLITIRVFAQTDTGSLHIANEMESNIHQMLNAWYPRAMDTTYGGFITEFTYDFKPTSNQIKFIVTQARHTWPNET